MFIRRRLLIAGDGAERGNAAIGVHEIPETLRTEARQSVLDLDGAAYAHDIRVRIGTRDAGPPGVRSPIRNWVMFVAVPVGPVGSARFVPRSTA